MEDDSPACAATLVEDIVCMSKVLGHVSSKQTDAEVQQVTQTNMEDVDVQGDGHCFSASTEGSLMDSEVAALVDGGVHYLQNSHSHFFGLDENSLEVEVANSEEASIIQELGLPPPYEAKMEKCLSKSATFPSSGLEFPYSFCVEENSQSPSTTSSSQDASFDQLPTYKRSVSLPAPIKLISAMKGGRAQNGTMLKSNLNVKWASDVYDPPGNSMMPVMLSTDQGLPKLKKKDKQRHKHAKGKGVHGSSSSGKKHAKRLI